MLSVEDSKPALVGGAAAVGASLAVNPTISVALGSLLAVVVKNRTDPDANFMLVGGLMLTLVGIGGVAIGSFPGAPVAVIGAGGSIVGGTFLWVGKKIDQWAIGRILRFLWALVHLGSTLVVIAKIAVVLPLTFVAGVVGADVPILGNFTFVLYCLAVMFGFYAIDQGKSVFQVRRKMYGSRRRASVDDVKNAAATAEKTAQKAEDVGASVRDADAQDVKQAASSAKETVSSVRGGGDDGGVAASDGGGAAASDGGGAAASDTQAPTAAESGADGPDEPTAESATRSESTTASADRSAGGDDDGSVSTDWLSDAADPSLVVRNHAGESKSARVGCRVDGEKRLADDVTLGPGDATDWDDLPTDDRFEVGVVVDDGPSAGERFDPSDAPDEIRVTITDWDVVFDAGDGSGGDAASGSADSAAASDAGAADSEPTSPESDPASSGTVTASSGTGSSGDAAGASGAGTGSASRDDPEPARSSSAADKVFGGATGGSDDGGASGETPDPEDESWDGAADLAAAVRDSPSEARVERLTEFLDSASVAEREAAIRGLRQSVRDHPGAVAGAVPSVAALLDADVGETREEAIVTLQRLAETHPDAVARATDAVVARLDDGSPKVRTAACRTLEATGASAGTEKLRELADEDSHKGVQVAAFHALQSAGN
ncbi:HEAT repeat domain-containing protein [Halorussus halobius]|uniref:HEAT repeat domain-containing protein n=1 Tax=Halorussus halobius TaxID=1710537 RepID=UPI001092681C|nr:HEAT repeat domain-containing protein [Halorussus halobius]